MHAWTWLAVAGVCAVLELLNFGLVFASFAIGALAASLARVAGANVAIQWIVLAVATVLSLRLKPVVTKYIFRKTPPSDTGINALIGHKAVATSEIDDARGTITLKGETWTARTDGESIANATEVTVVRIDGAVAIVAPRKNS